MSRTGIERPAAVEGRWKAATAADLGVAAVLVAACCCVRLGAGADAGIDWGRWIGLAGLLAAAIWLVLRFPRTADPEDLRESLYRAGPLGRRWGIAGGFGGLGRFGALRMAAAVAVLILAVDPSAPAGRTVPATVGVIGLVLTVAVEPFVVRLLRLPAPFVSGLPGAATLPNRTRAAWWIAPIGLLGTVAAGIIAAAGLSGWLILLISVLGAVPVALLIRQVRDRRRVAAELRRRLPEAVQAYRPEFLLYTARPDDASYQLQMWLPYLARAGRRFMIITREELPAEAIAPVAAASDVQVPVVCCRSVADLDLIMTDSLRAAFYVNASSGNGALIRYHQLTHVYLGHGDSDKPPSYNPTHAMYDQIFTAGPAANRRYAEHGVLIDESKFRVVGRPQVEVITPAAPERIAARAAGAAPVVLYAPTWRGHVSETALSSLDRAEALVDALLHRGAEVIFRPHPFSYEDQVDTAVIERIKQTLAEDARRTGRRHRYGPAAETELDAFGCMNAADVMISDVSSVVSDFLFSAKPFAMVAPPTTPDDADFVADYPVARAGYLIDHDLDRLDSVLDELLTPGEDRLAGTRAAVRADYLGDAPVDGYADVFVDAVRVACDVPAPQVAEVAESDDGSTTIGRDTVRRNLDSLARTIITGILAVLALAGGSGTGTAGVWIGAVAALIAVLVAGLTLTGRMRADTTLDGPRLILLLSSGVSLINSDLPGAAAGVGVLIMTLALVTEWAVRQAWSYPGVIADNLPGLTLPGPSRMVARLPLVALVAAAVGWLVTLLSTLVTAPLGWLLLAIGVGYAAVMITVVGPARTRLVAAATAEDEVPAVLQRIGPEFCVYFGSGIGASYQIGMWLPYFLRIGRPFVIITRSLPMLEEIRQLTRGTDVPVLYRATLRSLEEAVVPSLKLAFYVNNAVRNTHLIERRELTHIWLNHGDSEKPACYNPVHAIYDLIFAAGQAAVDRYARHGVTIPEQKFRIVGRPQTEVIRPAAERADEPTVLYAPTWQGPYADSRVYSLPVGQQIVDALLARGVRVIFRAHPFNYRFDADRRLIAEIGELLAADRDRTGRQHLWGDAAEQQLTVEECFNASDAMITDVSAVISDYLASGKPFAVVAVGRTEDELVAEAPAAAAGYTIAEDLTDLEPTLEELLITDPLAADRERVRVYYLGDRPTARAADGFVDATHRLLAGAVVG
ncbi:CDP-glycerol glycerophosphotransferase family protein [Microlunatus soli]|uniref:CDP-Glycerol:Poly(Glycerophosphate) glycerophosphotransferase n=1 Tax=Microlunatus soli TaxID=630515 RepID=A0A1H2AB33_9ACTN|nr:CDP-glycerol glycerophosphotransferase family protein [Microlunatus soli]SDT42706.1 CDP-Glycerol:Poly(glycerophosphate) glycerophosphotransferase [Microlunatus soli]